jgi:uncharacterized protein Usg
LSARGLWPDHGQHSLPHAGLPLNPAGVHLQEYDLAPRFPELNRFLSFWSTNLEGPLYRVRVAHKALLGPADLRAIDGEFRLN